MNQEIKKLWVDALRSGKYKPGRAALHRANDEFCCLGVLCNIAEQHGITERSLVPDSQDDSSPMYSYSGHDGFPPESVVAWAGLGENTTLVGAFDRRGNYDSALLHVLNDQGATQLELADLIEEQL